MENKKFTKFIMAGVLVSGVAGMATHAIAADKPKAEKCYGIAKAGKNDCGTASHACAGQSTKAGDPNEWMYVMKGNCDRIVGGMLKPDADNNDSKKSSSSTTTPNTTDDQTTTD